MRKFPSPPYIAVSVCAPTERTEVLNVATPDPLRVPVPSVVAPSLKETVPEGIPAPGATANTVAVKVTDSPVTLGLMAETTLVDVED